MDDRLIAYSKITVPSPHLETLSRQRLLDLCYNLLSYRLTLLIAPAGYGKTTLLVDLARHEELPVSWFSLDPLDKDPRRFLNHFIASLTRGFPNFGHETMATLQAMPGKIDWERLQVVLVNDIYDNIQEHFVLILDDYHLIDECEEISVFISNYVQQVDENCHLILSSRIPPALPDLPAMIAHSQVGGLDFKVLAFRPEEIIDLVQKNYNLTISPEIADTLIRETEGWITGLLLSAKTLGKALTTQIRSAQVSKVGLYDYLAEQVLNQQPEMLQKFLLFSSILGEFDADLCTKVLESIIECNDYEWQALINEAVQRNLFIQLVGDEKKWFRYHHLFQNFLQERTAERYPLEREQILRRLATVLAESGEWERAYELFRSLDDNSGLTNLIEEVGLAMIYATRQSTLAKWIDELPAEVRWSRPMLLSLRGSIAVDLGEMRQGLELLNQARELAEESGDMNCLAYTLIRRANIFLFLARYEESLKDIETALDINNDQESQTILAIAYRVKGLALHQTGQLEEAVVSLIKALQFNELLGRLATVALLHNDLGAVYRALGDYEDAQQAYMLALNYWQQFGNIPNQAYVLNNLGVLDHYQGRYESAGRNLDEAVIYARRSGFQRVLALALASIGDLYTDLEASEAAMIAYREAEEISYRIKYTSLRSYVTIAQARAARLSGEISLARTTIKQAELFIQSAGLGNETSLYHLEYGRLLLAEGKISTAVSYLDKAAKYFQEGGNLVEAACASLTLASAQLEAGNEDIALKAFILAFRLVTGLRDCHFLVLTGRESKNFLEKVSNDPNAGSFAKQLLQQISEFETSIPLWRRQLRPQATMVPFAQPTLIVKALGNIQVELAGKTIPRSEWKSRLAADLLFLLLAHPNGLTRNEIGVLFWPESSPARMKLSFEKTIYRLRRALTRDVVVFNEEDGRYYFNWDLDYWYDVTAFKSAIAEAQQGDTIAEAITPYEKALEIYLGPYLPDVDGMWVVQQQEALAGAYREAALNLVNLYIDQRDYKRAMQHCSMILTKDPYLEAAHRLMMRIHAVQGNLADVTRQFRICKQILEDDMQILPSDKTIELYESLVQNLKVLSYLD